MSRREQEAFNLVTGLPAQYRAARGLIDLTQPEQERRGLDFRLSWILRDPDVKESRQDTVVKNRWRGFAKRTQSRFIDESGGGAGGQTAEAGGQEVAPHRGMTRGAGARLKKLGLQDRCGNTAPMPEE